jgi:long-chain acyl-CoA synthetase
MSHLPWIEHYDDVVSPKLEYQDLCVIDLLDRSVRDYPSRPALIFQGRTLTYRELGREVDRCAAAFADLGVQAGKRVAIQLPNLPQTVIAYFAAHALGAEVVMTNPLYTVSELRHQWSDAEVYLAVVIDFVFEPLLREHMGDLAPKHFVVASIPEYLPWPVRWLAPFKLKRQDPPRWVKVQESSQVHCFGALLSRAGACPPRTERDASRIAVLQYTGGTTGPSKGAMLTHKNLCANVEQIHQWYGRVRMGEEVILSAIPLFHVFGLTVCMNWSAFAGGCQVLVANPRDLDAIVKAIVKHKVAYFPAVPALFNGLNQLPGIADYDLSSLDTCISGSAPIPIAVLEEFERLTGSRIIEGFGMSETSPVTHVNPLRGQRKVGSVGVPVPDTIARVVSTDGRMTDMPVGQEGELIIQGPQVMLGYLGRPDATAEALKDGWMHTGDLAEMDEDGFFRIVGRMKDMINCNGMKVFPDEVDQVLAKHPAILEAATIGIPDAKRGETVKSFVVLHDGQDVDGNAIMEYCREHLASYKVPQHVAFLEALPKSSVMKVLRRELRELELG